MDLLGGLTSLIGGGITGLVGTIVSNVYAYKSKQLDLQLEKQKDDHDIALKEVEGKLMAQEWAAHIQVAQIQSDAAVETEDSKAFAVSLATEPQRYAVGELTKGQNWFMVALDVLRGFIRPGLTLYLVVLTTMIYLQVRKLLGVNIDVTEAAALLIRIIDTVLFLTSTVVLWWFGTRLKKEKK